MSKTHFLIVLIVAVLLGWAGPSLWFNQQLPWLQLLGMGLLAYTLSLASLKQLLILVSVYGLLVQWQSLSWLFEFNQQFATHPEDVHEPLAWLYIMIIGQQFLLAFLLPAILSYWLFRPRPSALLWGVPVVFTIFEAMRARVFTGFALGQPGYGLIDSIWSSALPLFGVLGLTFLAWLLVSLLVNLLVTICLQRACLKSLWWPLGLLVCLPFSQWLTWSQPLAPVPVRIVHESADVDMKGTASGRWQRQQRLQALSDSATAKLILWPEGAVSAGLGMFGVVADFATKLQQQGQELLFGAYPQLPGGEYNAIMRGHDLRPLYHKRHLIPFGEYLPNNLFQFTAPSALTNLAHTQLQAGKADQPDISHGDTQLRPLICFEVMFGHELRKAGIDFGAFLYLNDLSWVRDTLLLKQSLLMARTRAMEFAKPLLAVSNQGISGYIQPDGTVQSIELGTLPVALDILLTPSQGMSGYARWGDIPLLILLTLYLLHAGWQRRNKTGLAKPTTTELNYGK